MKTSSPSVSDEAIRAFWLWFSSNHSILEGMLDRHDTGELARQMNARINSLSPQMAWEIGPGLAATYMLAFPSEGNADRKAVIERITQAAPSVERWEFHSSRPSRPFQSEVRLPDRGLTFQTSGWCFILEPSAASDRFDLRVFDDRLAASDQKTALTALFILLDAVLGEDIVERWIGNIQVLPRSGQHGSLLPMPSISERLAQLIP